MIDEEENLHRQGDVVSERERERTRTSLATKIYLSASSSSSASSHIPFTHSLPFV